MKMEEISDRETRMHLACHYVAGALTMIAHDASSPRERARIEDLAAVLGRAADVRHPLMLALLERCDQRAAGQGASAQPAAGPSGVPAEGSEVEPSEDEERKRLIISRVLTTEDNGTHARVCVWNRGAYAGELTLASGDAREVMRRLEQ